MAIKERSVGKCILFTILTCGIYGIYWIYKLATEALYVADPENKDMVTTLICLIFFPVVIYLVSKKFYEALAARGAQVSDNSILFVILSFCGLGIVPMVMLQGELNKLASE